MYAVFQKVDLFPSTDISVKGTTRLGPSERDRGETKLVISRIHRLLLSNVVKTPWFLVR
jgi:hypothetical protein